MTREMDSIEALRRAASELPACLSHALDAELPPLAHEVRRVVTTGIGASEAPARILAFALSEAGVCARFRPLSSFALDAPTGDLLVVFSQGLSPNARLALGDRHGFGSRWLVTSVCADGSDEATLMRLESVRARGVRTIVVPPAREHGMLVRIVGPTVAALVALRIASALVGDTGALARLSDAPDAYRSSSAPDVPLESALAIVTAGVPTDFGHAQRWKLLEGLLIRDPPVWDVLQIAHGPLQSFHREPITLLVLEHARASSLVDRLGETLSPERHRMVRLVATRDDATAFFQHSGSVDALLISTLASAPRDLYDWPARGADRPLYGFGEG